MANSAKTAASLGEHKKLVKRFAQEDLLIIAVVLIAHDGCRNFPKRCSYSAYRRTLVSIVENHDDLAGYYDEVLLAVEDPDFILRGYG